jgi:hypothetical protein
VVIQTLVHAVLVQTKDGTAFVGYVKLTYHAGGIIRKAFSRDRKKWGAVRTHSVRQLAGNHHYQVVVGGKSPERFGLRRSSSDVLFLMWGGSWHRIVLGGDAVERTIG